MEYLNNGILVHCAQQVCLRFAASRRLGLRKTAVGLRPLCVLSPPQFGQGSMLRIAL